MDQYASSWPIVHIAIIYWSSYVFRSSAYTLAVIHAYSICVFIAGTSETVGTGKVVADTEVRLPMMTHV